MTFETFVSCRANDFLLEVARVVATEGDRRPMYNPLYIYGEVGMGKTHLLSAIANRAQARRAVLMNVADLDAELEYAERLRARAELRRWLSDADVLLIDDIQLCKGREDVQRELFALFNRALRERRSLVIASDVPPTRLRDVENRLLSRLGSGVMLGLQLGDKAARLEILRRFLAGRWLADEVLDYLAEHVTDNVRRLKGAAAQLLATQERIGAPADLTLARAVVPLESDLRTSRLLPPPDAEAVEPGLRFKEMLAGAETEEEQALALQIALGERARELRASNGSEELLQRLERALALLREGKRDQALVVIDGGA